MWSPKEIPGFKRNYYEALPLYEAPLRTTPSVCPSALRTPLLESKNTFNKASD